MDLMEKLKESVHISAKKRVDKRLIYTLGLFGVLVPVLSVWLAISDMRTGGVVSEARSEGHQAVEDLMQPIQALKRAMGDEQVQALAVRALENPETATDLSSYLNGRINQISGVSVFSTDLSGINPTDLGPNGFAVFDMILSTLASQKGQMQVHQVLQPPAVPGSEGKYLVVKNSLKKGSPKTWKIRKAAEKTSKDSPEKSSAEPKLEKRPNLRKKGNKLLARIKGIL